MRPRHHRLWMLVAAAASAGLLLFAVPAPHGGAQTQPPTTPTITTPGQEPPPSTADTTPTTVREDDPNYNHWGTTTTVKPTTTTAAPPAGGGGGGSNTGGGSGGGSSGGAGGSEGGGSGSGGSTGGGGTTSGGPVTSPPPPSGGGTVLTFPMPPAVPPMQGFGDLQAFDDLFAYQPSPGSRSTKEVVDLLQGAGVESAVIARVLAPFPVLGVAHYSDDWGAPRLVPTFHSHQGVDVFAARGTPVISSSAGVVTEMQTGTAIGGNTVYVTAADGTYFYYAHLEAHAPGLAKGQEVDAGDVLGFVGTSGNAEGTSPHLHYEIHPQGGGPVPPVPYLDSWLKDAIDEAQALTGQAAPVDLSALGLPEGTGDFDLPPLDAASNRTLTAAPQDPPEDPTGVLVLLGAVIAFFVWRRYKATHRVEELVTTSPLLLMSMRGKPSRLIPRGEGHQHETATEAAVTTSASSSLGGDSS
jgi:murein DD-endopeptidase MepM/ murein hydrolase activator NlpD